MDEITDFLKLERFKFSFENVNQKYKYNKKITYEYNIPDFASVIARHEKELGDENKK